VLQLLRLSKKQTTTLNGGGNPAVFVCNRSAA
jgi:hypothetical protein